MYALPLGDLWRAKHLGKSLRAHVNISHELVFKLEVSGLPTVENDNTLDGHSIPFSIKVL